LQKWYDLFPENPYARIGGLVPAAFFVTVIITTNIGHFIYGYSYIPQVTKLFSSDISLVRANLKDGATILAPMDSLEYDFYKIFESRHDISVTSQVPTDINSLTIVLKSFDHTKIEHPIDKIITSHKINDADRLYIYDTISK
jgi:hypothetical protein